MPQGYISRLLKHFETKFCNFTDFNKDALPAVVMNFVLLAKIKIYARILKAYTHTDTQGVAPHF